MLRLLPLVAVLLSPPALAQGGDPVGLELVLLADASGSIDASERALQRQGYADALRDPGVLRAIEEGLWSRIAVTYVEWAETMDVVVDWTIIEGAGDAEDFAQRLLAGPSRARGRNAIGTALLTGLALIEGNDIDGVRGVIDFSGDSARNFSGPSPEIARDQVVAAGITINALPILRPEEGPAAGLALQQAYLDRIIGGPGAFMVPAEGRATFAQAIRRKLILEIAGEVPDGQRLAGLQD